MVEEKIADNNVVVRATMTSLSSEVIADANSKYRAILKFNLNVSEYLKGTGPSSIVAVWVDGRPYDARDEANDAKAGILIERDDQWDDREGKRIEHLMPGYPKRVHGPLIAEKIGLEVIRNECPRFDRWLVRLESLGSA